MAIGTAGNWKVFDEFKNWAGHKSMVAKRSNSGAGTIWILDGGVWNDAGVWDDASVWKDSA